MLTQQFQSQIWTLTRKLEQFFPQQQRKAEWQKDNAIKVSEVSGSSPLTVNKPGVKSRRWTDSTVREGLKIHFLNGLRQTGIKICPCAHGLHISSLSNSYCKRKE